MVGREQDLGLVAVFSQHVVDDPAPVQGVAHFRAARREHVVESPGHHLARAERVLPGEKERQLGRRFGIRSIEKFERHAVDDRELSLGADFPGRRNQTDVAGRGALAEADADLAFCIERQMTAEVEQDAAVHCRSGEYVLAHRFGHEAVRGDDLNAPLGDLLLRHDAPDAAEMIHVRMGVDDRGDRPLAQVSVRELQSGGSHRGRSQRVDDDPAVLSFDEGHHGQVVAAELPDVVRDLEQPVNRIQLTLAPQRRVGRGGRSRLQKVVPA